MVKTGQKGVAWNSINLRDMLRLCATSMMYFLLDSFSKNVSYISEQELAISKKYVVFIIVLTTIHRVKLAG